MSEFKLFSLKDGVREIVSNNTAFDLERQLQDLVEHNMSIFFAVDFVKSEWAVSIGRMDSVGLDENMTPVIFEYKRNSNDNVINQGLYYLDWLKDHKGDFKDIVREKLGNEKANEIDWSNPRVICIANDFNKYDEHAVMQMHANISLIRYKKYQDLIAFERLYGDESLNNETISLSTSTRKPYSSSDGPVPAYDDFINCLERIENMPELKNLFIATCDYIENLGELEKMQQKKYLAFKKIKNIICVEIKTSAQKLHLFLRADLEDIEIKKMMSERKELRDVSTIGHYGTGDLELTISNIEDLQRNQDILKYVYDNN